MSARPATAVAAAVAAAMLLAGCAAAPLAHDPSTRLPPEARDEPERQVVVTFDDARIPRLLAAPGATPRVLGGGGTYRGSPRAQDLARALARDHGLQWVAAWRIDVLGVHCVVFRLPAGASRDAVLTSLRADDRVESAQPMQTFATSAAPPGQEPAAAPARAPDDAQRPAGGDTARADGTERRAEWDDPYYPLQRALPRMRVPQAQRLSTGQAVRVAIVDTGADLRHPDLAQRVAHAANFVDEDAARFRRDRHGTAVAGAIAATANNATGIVGVAPGVRLSLLKACWEAAPGEPGRCNSLTLAAALAHAIDRQAQVINLSLTGPADPLLERLVRRALAAGIVVVAADPRLDAAAPAPFPVALAGVIGVRDADARARSGGGVAAPGRDVLTTVPGGHYDFVSGTSMSVALASGVVALVLQTRPDLAGDDVGRLLRDTAAGTLQPADLASAPAVATLDAEGALLALRAGRAVRSGRVVAGTPRCGSAGRSAECR